MSQENDGNEGLWDRTLRRVRRAWPLGAPAPLKEAVSPELGDSDAQRIRAQINACLAAHGGEVSARARAAELGETYLVLNENGRRRFLEILARDYDVDSEAIDAAIARRAAAEDRP